MWSSKKGDEVDMLFVIRSMYYPIPHMLSDLSPFNHKVNLIKLKPRCKFYTHITSIYIIYAYFKNTSMHNCLAIQKNDIKA